MTAMYSPNVTLLSGYCDLGSVGVVTSLDVHAGSTVDGYYAVRDVSWTVSVVYCFDCSASALDVTFIAGGLDCPSSNGCETMAWDGWSANVEGVSVGVYADSAIRSCCSYCDGGTVSECRAVTVIDTLCVVTCSLLSVTGFGMLVV